MIPYIVPFPYHRLHSTHAWFAVHDRPKDHQDTFRQHSCQGQNHHDTSESSQAYRFLLQSPYYKILHIHKNEPIPAIL